MKRYGMKCSSVYRLIKRKNIEILIRSQQKLDGVLL